MPTLPKSNRPHWIGPARKAWDRHANRWQGYKTNKWKEFSHYFKLANPICATPGCGKASYYTDHINPEDKYTDPLNPAKCQPLCWDCGNKKTSGEGHAVRRSGRADSAGDPGV